MAYNVNQEFGTVETAKSNTFAQVQLVTITPQTGNGQAKVRLDVREFVFNPNTGYEGPTKNAFAFDNPDDIDALIEALQEGRDALVAAPKPEGGTNSGRKNGPSFTPRKPRPGAGAAARKKAAARRTTTKKAS